MSRIKKHILALSRLYTEEANILEILDISRRTIKLNEKDLVGVRKDIKLLEEKLGSFHV